VLAVHCWLLSPLLLLLLAHRCSLLLAVLLASWRPNSHLLLLLPEGSRG
jgi:hypothetical protein